MNVVVLNGGPHISGPTSDMVSAFAEGAQAAGHKVSEFDVAHMDIRGCMACE